MASAPIVAVALLSLLTVHSCYSARVPRDSAFLKAALALAPLEKRSGEPECDDPKFRKSQLKLIKEMPFIGIFENLKGERKFEASGMTIARDALWVVFDNLHALGRIDEHFQFRGPNNVLVGELGGDSQFEGLTYMESTGHFLALQESTDDVTHGIIPITQEIVVLPGDRSYLVVRKCPVLFEVTHSNKGFEGIHYHEDPNTGRQYMLGLCEGNFCSGGSKGRRPGNGVIVVAELQDHTTHGDYDCAWEVVKEVKVPSSAYFQDYSDMAFLGNKVAILSQENSSLWLGTFDFDRLDFAPSSAQQLDKEGGAQLYHFPRDIRCKATYCNVEGVQWLDESRLVIASDKAKANQPYECSLKDQLLSVFALP